MPPLKLELQTSEQQVNAGGWASYDAGVPTDPTSPLNVAAVGAVEMAVDPAVAKAHTEAGLTQKLLFRNVARPGLELEPNVS